MKEMIKSFQIKDYQLFDTFYDMTYKQVFFTLRKYIKDEMMIEDLMQETYVKFLKYILDVNPDGNIKSYLTTIARNLAIDHLRKSSKVEFNESYVMDYKEEITQTYDALYLLDILSPKEKQIVTLHIVESMTFKDISIIEKEPLGTILWRYQKALKKMKVVYKDANKNLYPIKNK
jgi:RNA polymerase sigma-70 factor (ECF subfamily)